MVKIYVEGGGHKSLDSELRRAFRQLFDKAGVVVQSIQIVAGGSREETFEKFQRECSQGTAALLLVDSEGPVSDAYQQGAPEDWSPWGYLREASGDRWQAPPNAEETDCHLMVQCMENWFLVSPQTLQQYFGQGFNQRHLPGTPANVEFQDKTAVLEGLRQATRRCSKRYDKSRDSFKVLGRLDPGAIRAGSGWADRLFRALP